MKLRNLLLMILGVTSGLAYASIPGMGPYKNITTVSSQDNTVMLVDSKGQIFSSSDGVFWNTVSQFNTTHSPKYFAYSDMDGNGYFYNQTGNEAWKYNMLNGNLVPINNVLNNNNVDVVRIGTSIWAQYSVIKSLNGLLSPKIYYKDGSNTSWIKYTALQSPIYNYLIAFGGSGSSGGGFMTLGSNNTYLYNENGLVNTTPYPGDCNTNSSSSSPSFLGAAGLNNGYYLMCGTGPNAYLYWYDSKDNNWHQEAQFDPNQHNAKYVMAQLPNSSSYAKAAVSSSMGRQEEILTPTISIILSVENNNNLGGRLCLSGLSDIYDRPYQECSDIFYFNANLSGSEILAGTIYNKGTNAQPNYHAIFVGSKTQNMVLDIPIVIKEDETSGNTVSVDQSNIVWK